VSTSLRVNGTAGLLGVILLVGWWTSRDTIVQRREA